MTQSYVIVHTHTHRLVLKSFSVFLGFMFWAMVSFGQDNYGNFQANQYAGAANSSVILGSLPSTTPTARFYINTTTQNGAEINVTGSYLNGLRVTTNGYYSKGLFAQSTHPVSYAAYFEGHTYISTKLGVGFSPLSMASHEKLAIRNGMITTSGIGNGISLNGSYYSSTPNDFGTQRYGLFMGDDASIDLAMGQATGRKPIILSSFYGLGFDVNKGKMVFCENGTIYMGDNSSEAISRFEILANYPTSIVEEEYRLYVETGIRTEKVKVDAKGEWPDFVFEKNYKLPPLNSVEQYINKNKHLPNVPSAAEVEKEGIDLGEMDKVLLQKIEELTLYTIEQEKRLTTQQVQLEQLQKQVAELSSNNSSKN